MTNKKKGIRNTSGYIAVALGMLIMGPGCMSPEVRKEGIVRWNYKSAAARQPDSPALNVPLSIGISKIEWEQPYTDLGFPTATFRMVPLLSLWAAPRIDINGIVDNGNERVDLKDGEIESILNGELVRSGIAVKSPIENDNPDFRISGRIFLINKSWIHLSGLGMLYSALLLPAGLLPYSSEKFECEARFTVTAASPQRTVLDKEYKASSEWTTWLLYNTRRKWTTYGQEVFPRVVEQFIADLKAVPQSEWESTLANAHAANP